MFSDTDAFLKLLQFGISQLITPMSDMRALTVSPNTVTPN